MKRLVIGILAHVDAGKTTLAESMLYLTGKLRKLGRVDHKNAFLDTYELERARGITIFSKQATFTLKDIEVTLLDTPGHVDFSAEMERTLQVMDYAVLVISGSEGIQGHTETLWRLLNRYQIPTYLFVNKMDLVGADRKKLMKELKTRLNDGCIDFSEESDQEEFMESLAMCDEALLNQYLETGNIKREEITKLIAKRKVFPCFFGSALKLNGVEAFLEGIEKFTRQPHFSKEFGAKIYKIARDENGIRLTYLKVTGGSLNVKMLLSNGIENGSNEDTWAEKVDQIRIYSGEKYETVDEVEAGAVCAVTGLSKTYPGEGLGIEAISHMPLLQPVLSYQILLSEGVNVFEMLSKLRQLEEEDPQLHIAWNERLKEIHVKLMGEVQIEILKSLIQKRFGVDVEFSSGSIVYKETIAGPVVGVGHYEPLRHYAEVHLLLEPGEPGSGLIFSTKCSEDELDRNWQRLILSHLEEKEHLGVITGSPITDMKITLIAGRAHQKHTEGGDFRQATYRAVRQGLKKSESVLLEPYYEFRIEIPSEVVGRAMSDITQMHGKFRSPEINKEMSIIIGTAPVATMRGYQRILTSYTRGMGRLFCTLKGYEPCHNASQVFEEIGYDSERDLENPTSSVFCSHGAGFVVEWDKVSDYMHLESGWEPAITKEKSSTDFKIETYKEDVSKKSPRSYSGSWQEDKELEAIFTRTFGAVKRKQSPMDRGLGYEKNTTTRKDIQVGKITASVDKKIKKEYLLVDGYNIIFSWDELHDLAKFNLDAARNKLIDILCNYQGFKKCEVILVFDAYKVKGGVGEIIDYHNIHVVYTKEAETADMYIEKVTRDIDRLHHVVVATSDALEQLIILGQGATRLSAKDFKEEILRVNDQIRKDYLDKPTNGRFYLKNQLNKDIFEVYTGENE